MGERRRRSPEELSSEEHAKLEAFLARNRSPAALAEEESVAGPSGTVSSGHTGPQTLTCALLAPDGTRETGTQPGGHGGTHGAGPRHAEQARDRETGEPDVGNPRCYAQALGSV